MKIFTVLAAPGLAVIICAFVFLPNLSAVEASPGVLPLLEEYAFYQLLSVRACFLRPKVFPNFKQLILFLNPYEYE